jgi:hypothetical protein
MSSDARDSYGRDQNFQGGRRHDALHVIRRTKSTICSPKYHYAFERLERGWTYRIPLSKALDTKWLERSSLRYATKREATAAGQRWLSLNSQATGDVGNRKAPASWSIGA